MELRAEAKTLFEKPSYHDAGTRRDSRDPRWNKMVLKSGTLADRIAALSLAVKRSPRTSVDSLDSLLGMLKKKSRRESLMALDALAALYKQELLPSDRKLVQFEKQSKDKLDNLSKAQREEMLSAWYQEDLIKTHYGDFLLELEALLKDQMETTRLKVLGVVFDLLVEKPEREDRLLNMLVNKLGDPEKKVASKASGFLVRLIRQHPNMKAVVVDEVERLIYRTNVAPKAQYYALCFLIQIKLSDNDPTLAVKLAVTAKKAMNPKMMSAILTGVNRTYPFTKGPQHLIEHIDTFFRYIHTVSAQTGIQILMLLYQVMEREGAITDRFYMALYRKMMDPELFDHSGRSSSLLNLLYKAMKRDTEVTRIKAFVKRILQLAVTQSPPFICGALIVISEVLKSKPKSVAAEISRTVKNQPRTDDGTVDAMETDQYNEGNALRKPLVGYSSAARNPLYCGTETTNIYEFHILRRHYHPSVVRFAECVLQNRPIDYAGDPFEDFTSVHFLDRFVYRNPKKKATAEEDVPSAKSMPVLSQQYLALPEKAIPDDEKFLHRYLTQRLKRKKDAMGHEDADVESVDDDEFDRFLDDYEQGEDIDADLDFATDVNDEQEERESLDEDGSLFGGGSDSDDDDFTSAEKDALDEAFSSDESDNDDDDDRMDYDDE